MEVTKLHYLEWSPRYEKEKPYQVFLGGAEEVDGIKDTNLCFKESPELVVNDLRGQEKDFNLDRNGFSVCTHETAVTRFGTAEEIEQVYLPEIEAMLKREVEDVGRVFFFDWRVSQWIP